MAKKRQEKIELVELERIEKKDTKKRTNISDSFYYLLGIIMGIILLFATKEFLSTVNYLFVVIFAVIGVVKTLNFVLEKDYEKKEYSDMVIGVMSIWIAVFVFKYGQFLFLELLPVLVSLLLFVMGLSSLTKYFSHKNKINLIMSIISLLLGVLLILLPGSIMNICFKVTGIYLLVTIILDLIDVKTKAYK